MKKSTKQLLLNASGHGYNDIYFFIIPLLLPLLRQEFGLTYAQSGLLLSVHVALRSGMSLFSGHLGDIFDRRYILCAGFIISSVMLAGLIFSQSFISVAVLLVLLAVGVSTFHPLATAMVGERVAGEELAYKIGIFEAAGGMGIILASFTFGYLVEFLGWRLTCFYIALLGIPLGVAYLFLREDDETAEDLTLLRIPRRQILIFLCGRGMFFLGGWAFLSFLPTYASDHLGLRAGISSWYVGITFMGTMIGNILLGKITDRTRPLSVILICIVALVPVLFGITSTLSPIVLVILTAIYGFFQGGLFTSQNAWLTVVSTRDTRGKTLGASFLFEGISATVAPSLYGWIGDRAGLVGSFRWAAVPIAMSMFFFLYLFRKNIDRPASQR